MLPVLPEWAAYGAWAAYMLLEYWLGKTKKVDSGSTLEVVLKTTKNVLGAIKKEPPRK